MSWCSSSPHPRFGSAAWLTAVSGRLKLRTATPWPRGSLATSPPTAPSATCPSRRCGGSSMTTATCTSTGRRTCGRVSGSVSAGTNWRSSRGTTSNSTRWPTFGQPKGLFTGCINERAPCSDRRPTARDLGPGGQRDGLFGGPGLHRLHVGHLRGQHRPFPSWGGRGAACPTRSSTPAHLHLSLGLADAFGPEVVSGDGLRAGVPAVHGRGGRGSGTTYRPPGNGSAGCGELGRCHARQDLGRPAAHARRSPRCPVSLPAGHGTVRGSRWTIRRSRRRELPGMERHVLPCTLHAGRGRVVRANGSVAHPGRSAGGLRTHGQTIRLRALRRNT